MTTRPASPPPVKRWPFVLGDVLLLGIALGVVVLGGSPPGLVTLVVVAICVLLGVGLLVAPYLMEYEARVRFAEAATHDQLEIQARRLAQTVEQLSHAVSRSQSTEEQAGQALGTIEELTEKLTSQSDELASALARSTEREIADLKLQLERVARERDQQLASLQAKIASVATTIQESHSATKLSIAAHAKVVDDIHIRLDAIGGRVEDVSRALDHLRASSSSKPAPRPVPPHRAEHPKRNTEPAPSTSTPAQPPAATVEENPSAPPSEDIPPSTKAPAKPASARKAPQLVVVSDETDDAPAPAPATATAPSEPVSPKAPRPEELPELPLEGMPPPRPPMKFTRRELAGATSIVATAYIGIGNKLYLRGEGPGLSWDRGVPMQFLAIGKWGWTTTEAGGPVTCRIFRNDETPMLDADVVVAPGEKAEITPRF
jgi:hypothetical protein